MHEYASTGYSNENYEKYPDNEDLDAMTAKKANILGSNTRKIEHDESKMEQKQQEIL